MSGISESNSSLIARSYDSNKDGFVSDNLKIRKDEKTTQALGNSDKLSVDQLSIALKTNKVMIKDGEIFASNKELKIPALHQDFKNANTIASNALAQTTSWAYIFVPSEPNSSDYAGPAQYTAAMASYKISMRQYEQDIKIDRAILVNALQNVSTTTNDPQIKKISDNAMKNIVLNNVVGLIFNERNHDVVLQDRANLRRALSTIKDMTNFKQPNETISQVSKEISEANGMLEKEKLTITNKSPIAIKNLEVEAEKDGKSWFFGKTRAESDKKEIESIKNLNPKIDEDKLSNLARKNYENAVNMIDGFSVQDAKSLSTESNNLSGQINTINKNAKSGINLIEKNAK